MLQNTATLPTAAPTATLDALLLSLGITPEELNSPDRRHSQASAWEYAAIIAAERGISILPYPDKGDPIGGRGVKSGIPTAEPIYRGCPSPEIDPFDPDQDASPADESDTDLYEGLSLQVELGKPSMCRTTVIKMECPTGDFVGFRPMACGKWWCPDCGNTYEYYTDPKTGKRGHRVVKSGPIQARREASYYQRVDIKTEHCHSFVFTLSPAQRRELIADPEKYDKCWDALHNLMVGNHKNGRHKIKGEYSGKTHKIISMTHPHGDEIRDGLKPHFNVQVWFPAKYKNGRERRWSVPDSKLARIKRRWKKMCDGIFTAKSTANVHVWNWIDRKSKRHGISYVVRPPDPKILEHISVQDQRFLLLYLRGKQHMHFWGLASNSHQKSWADCRKNKRKTIQCPICNQTLQVSMVTDKNGNLRPCILTRERLELELEGGYDHG